VIVQLLVSHPDGRDKDLEGDDAVEQDRAPTESGEASPARCSAAIKAMSTTPGP
jgi:hypothetical protein